MEKVPKAKNKKGLSGGAIAAIVIIILILAGVGITLGVTLSGSDSESGSTTRGPSTTRTASTTGAACTEMGKDLWSTGNCTSCCGNYVPCLGYFNGPNNDANFLCFEEQGCKDGGYVPYDNTCPPSNPQGSLAPSSNSSLPPGNSCHSPHVSGPCDPPSCSVSADCYGGVGCKNPGGGCTCCIGGRCTDC